ncbi:hypothetical protein [Leifsonia sp. Root112D2]|uniref:hypothetical protein n=1 Tax=Leifsonia sp. Root112D2 TaxID=1736426 RepID=UPI0006FB5BBA|nr:hypothetical protein [Leifsonia sp. Root112D2]KQV05037.1 hypothetical protein ASC63_14565 [Leifsonia sp. Root112D2]
MVTKFRLLAFWTLVVVTVFNALSAISGGIAILATGGLEMPLSMLTHSPFGSFTGPGWILLIVVGGTQTISFVLLLLRKEMALVWTAIAGIGMTIWIFIETGIIAGISWLQALYFATGVAQLVLVLALLGIVRWLPRETLNEAMRRGLQNMTQEAQNG